MKGPSVRWQRPLRVEADMTVASLVEEMANSSFGARSVARACRLVTQWVADSEIQVIVAISGALSIAQQTSIVGQLIAAKKVHAIVTTGAVVSHSLTHEAGGHRRAVLHGESDETFARSGLNRVFDTVESDQNLLLLRGLVEGLTGETLSGGVSSRELLAAIGMSPKLEREGLVSVAARMNTPIFVPALSDSELGLRLAEVAGRAPWTYDAFADLRQFRDWLQLGRRFAVLCLGGGVPRNWTQQMFAEINEQGLQEAPTLVSAIRVCPDGEPLGHLSGSTFSEARSWRKIPAYDPEAFVEVSADFTIVFPLIAVQMLAPQTASE